MANSAYHCHITLEYSIGPRIRNEKGSQFVGSQEKMDKKLVLSGESATLLNQTLPNSLYLRLLKDGVTIKF